MILAPGTKSDSAGAHAGGVNVLAAFQGSREDVRDRSRIARAEWPWLGGVLVIALFARLPGLNASLWYDEIITVVNFARLPVERLVATFDSLNNHMLYSLAAHFCLRLFGEHAWSVRLPALLFGLGSIAATWALARRALDRWPALLVALLLALSYHHVWFSQNARGYTMLMFFTSTSLLLFLQGLERPRWSTWSGFAFLTAAAIYTHLSAGFFYMALGIAALVLWVRALSRRRAFPLLQLVYGGLLSIGLAVLLHWPVIRQAARAVSSVSEKTATSGQALAEWQNPLRAFQEIGNSLAGTTPLIPLVIAVALLVVIVGAVGLARREPAMLLVYAIHIPLTLFLLRLLSFRIWPRYFFTDIGFIFILIVLGVVLIVKWVAQRLGRPTEGLLARRLLAAATAAMIIVSLPLLMRDYSAPKQDYVGARDWVQARLAAGDRVGAVGLATVAYGSYYRPGWRSANSLEELHALRRAGSRAWILVSFPHQTQGAHPDVMAEIARDFDRVAVFPGTLGDGAIWIFRSRVVHG